MFEAPGGEANDMFQFKMEGFPESEKKTDNYIGIFPCDYSFASIFKLTFLAGSNFSETNEDNEGSGEYIVNESAMRRLNYSDPGEIIGKEFRLITNIDGIDLPEGKITGVVEDFHLSGIKKKIEPLVLFKRKELWLINIVISFRPGMRNKALSDLEKVWKEMYPGYPMQYNNISSLYSNIYKSERLQGILLAIFTFISLFICSMGLLGMSLLATRRRTKEIGLRKISGATIGEVIILLNRDLIRWVIVSFLIAAPVAFLVMDKWLENFAYKISPGWWIFLLSGLAAVLTALLTVSVQSWKAAAANPVEALRYE